MMLKHVITKTDGTAIVLFKYIHNLG